MKISNAKCTKILTNIKEYIESKYEYEDMELYKHEREKICSYLKFKLVTPYYSVPIKFLREHGWGEEANILLCVEFKNPRKQKHGVTGGYGYSIYENNYKTNYLNKINYKKIDTELQGILNNIKENGTWCDESLYDD